MRRAAAVAAAVVLALGAAGCGESPEDEARDDGEDVGEAMRALFDAQTPEQAQEAVGDLRDAAGELTQDTADAVRPQLETQRSTLAGAVGGSPEEWRDAVQQARAQADAFRSGADSVANEFWRGFQEGYEDG